MKRIIGLTGGIATGKSTVTKILQKKGIKVIDADKIAHEMQKKGSPVLVGLTDLFGPDILTKEGQLNREHLGSIIFGDVLKKELLDAYMFPRIKDELIKLINEANESLIFIDVPLLFEAGFDNLVHQSVVIAADESIQIERLMKRNNISRVEALKRISSQMSIKQKVELADIVIENNGSYEELEFAINNMITNL